MNPPRETSPRKSRFAESLLKARSKGKSPSVIPLYGIHRVTIKPSDEMKEILEEINKSLKKLANSDKSTSQIVQEVLSQPLGEPGTTEEVDEPAELSGVNTEALSTFEEEKYGHLVRADEIAWNSLDESVDPKQLFNWREEGDVLILRYSGTSCDTNWETIRRLLKYKAGRERTGEIIKVIGSNTSKKIVAFRTFLRHIESGIIEMPAKTPDKELEENMKAFQEEEDPDAVYKPMLKAYSTRPDPNCGKIEGSLEVM